MEIEWIDPRELVPYEKNAKIHDKKQIDNLAESMRRYGFRQPLVVTSDNIIVTGHGRTQAAIQAGLDKIPIIRADDLTPEQIQEYRNVDNLLNEGKYDYGLLAEDIDGLDFGNLDIDWGIPEIRLEEEEQEPAPYYGHTRERSFKQWNFLEYDESRTEGPYNFPKLEATQHVPKSLVGFDKFLPSREYESGVHFYLYDYQFERIWNSPYEYFDKLKKFDCVIQPDFSIYTDMPAAMQIWNHYRNHMLGQMMQDYGITVIPNIMWGLENTFEWVFDGLPENSALSVETVGCMQDEWDRKLWHKAMDRAIEKLHPTKILLYGSDIGYKFPCEVINIKNTNGERMKASRERIKKEQQLNGKNGD